MGSEVGPWSFGWGGWVEAAMDCRLRAMDWIRLGFVELDVE